MTYQGHKNWNHWNVALLLSNDYGMFTKVQHEIKVAPTRDAAARKILAYFTDRDPRHPPKTPDGAPYSFSSIRAALVGWES